MTYEKQQEVFDVVKWIDSVNAGCDMCGTYEFCHCCNKALKHPCARASKMHSQSGAVRVAVIRKKRTTK